MNFTYLKSFPRLKPLYRYCSDAEQLCYTHPYLSGNAARNALEHLVRLVYCSKIENDSEMTIFDMVADDRFRDYIGDPYVMNTIHYIRKMGNAAAHQGNLTVDEAVSVLENLHFLVGEILILFGVISDYPELQKPEPKKKPQPAPAQP